MEQEKKEVKAPTSVAKTVSRAFAGSVGFLSILGMCAILESMMPMFGLIMVIWLVDII